MVKYKCVYNRTEQKKNIPRILTKLKEMIDFELKTYHTTFCVPSSKGGRAISPQSGFIFEKKNTIFRHLHLLKMVQDPVRELKRCDLRFCICVAYFQFDSRPLLVLYQGVEELQMAKIDIFYFSKKCHQGAYYLKNAPKNLFQLKKVDLGRNSLVVQHFSATNL